MSTLKDAYSVVRTILSSADVRATNMLPKRAILIWRYELDILAEHFGAEIISTGITLREWASGELDTFSAAMIPIDFLHMLNDGGYLVKTGCSGRYLPTGKQ